MGQQGGRCRLYHAKWCGQIWPIGFYTRKTNSIGRQTSQDSFRQLLKF